MDYNFKIKKKKKIVDPDDRFAPNDIFPGLLQVGLGCGTSRHALFSLPNWRLTLDTSQVWKLAVEYILRYRIIFKQHVAEPRYPQQA